MPTPLPDPNSLRGALLTLANALSDFEKGQSVTTFTADSTDNSVSATVDGLMRVVSIRIDASELVLSAPALASKVKDVVNSALDQADTTTRAAVTTLASGLTLPGLPAYGSPVPDFLDFAFTSEQLEELSLANSPCDSGKTFECRKGGVVAVVSAKRRVVSLTFDEPLPTLAEHLATRTREAINCADEPATDPEEDPIIPEVTGSPGLHTLVLYAKGLLKLNDRVQVKTEGCADWATVANAGFVETNIGVETDVGNILSRARVFVRDRGRVHGFIRTSDVVETQNQTEIDGPIHENVGLVLPDLALNVTFPSTVDGTIELEPNQQQTAGPGYYNKLHPKSGAQVFLSSGLYYLNEFFLEPGSKLWLDQSMGPIVIWVKNAFTYRGEILVTGSGLPRLFIGYLGTSVAVVERVFRGTLSAPNAKINIASVTETYEGAFHGKDIEAFPEAQICHRRFELRYDELPGLDLPDDPFEPEVDLGFELLSGWSSPQGALSLVTSPISQGARSLQVSNVQGSTEVVSSEFSTALSPPGATRFLVDVWVPHNQPNPTFFGTLSVVLMVPSAGINMAILGNVDLTSLSQGEFNTIEFQLSAEMQQVLDGSHDDVSIRFVLDVNAGSGPWYLDDARFLPPPPPEPVPVEGLLSFEDLAHWSSSQVTLSTATSPKTHLQRSLLIPVIPGWTQAVSVPFSSESLSANEGKIRLDVWPSSNQPNQWWHGQFLVRFDVPSLGIEDAETPVAELTPLDKDTFTTVELDLPQNVRDAINAATEDVIVKPIVNGTPGSGPYYLDHIRFDPVPQGPAPGLDHILSFEDLNQWSSPQVALTTTTNPKTHLQRSLQFPVAPGWMHAISTQFGTGTLSAAQGKIRVDVWPSSNQPNQWWHGQFSVRFDVPSLGIEDAETNLIGLTPLTKDQFHTIELTLPQNIRDVINGDHPDLVVKPVLNVTPGSGPYYIDYVRFV